MTQGEAQERVFEATGEGFGESQLRPATKREIVVRMLRNLQGLAEREGGPGGVLRYLELIVTLSPDSAVDRMRRAQLRLQARDPAGAKEDLKWILDRKPEGVDLERVAEFYRSL